MIFAIIAAIVSLYLLIYTILTYPYDLISYLFFNLIVVGIFFGVGSLFDFKKLKTGFISSGVLLAILPFFSDLVAPSIVELNPYVAPWIIIVILPKTLQEGHPPAGIFLVPLFWIVLGIALAAWKHKRGNA